MTRDNELQRWSDEWRSQPEVLPDLAAHVRRQSRWMRLMVAAEVAITVVIGGGTTFLAATSRKTDVLVLSGATWLFIAIAWAFAIWNRKHGWRPSSLTTAAYLETSIRRCRSAIRSCAFGLVFYWVEMIFCLAWIYQRKGDASFLTSAPMYVVWGVTALFLVGCVLYRRRKKQELVRWLRMEESLTAETPSGRYTR